LKWEGRSELRKKLAKKEAKECLHFPLLRGEWRWRTGGEDDRRGRGMCSGKVEL
jgi:hypothetical protein